MPLTRAIVAAFLMAAATSTLCVLPKASYGETPTKTTKTAAAPELPRKYGWICPWGFMPDTPYDKMLWGDKLYECHSGFIRIAPPR
jgi:hypothetical protein